MSPVPVGPYFPTNDLVAVAWLGQRVPLLDDSQVATVLPRNPSSWLEGGFVTAATVAGSPDIEIPVRRPLVQVDCWAADAKSDGSVGAKPPWARANRLAELIRNATEDIQQYAQAVTLPAAYLGARVLAVYLVTEPSRVLDDPSGYARYTLDLAFDWVRNAA